MPTVTEPSSAVARRSSRGTTAFPLICYVVIQSVAAVDFVVASAGRFLE